MNSQNVHDRFLMDYKAAFQGREVEIGLKSNSAWTGPLDRADGTGVWLTEAMDTGTRVTWIPWEAIESTTMPPLPELK